MVIDTKGIIKYRHLFWMLTWRDLRIRYKQAIMGFAWVIFMPLLYLGAGIVLGRLANVNTGRVPYLLFVLIGVLPWSFFVSSIKFATTSLVSNVNLVTKIYFPRSIIPLSAIAACFVDFMVSIFFMAAVLIYYIAVGEAAISAWAFFVPLVIASQCLFTFGVGLLLSMCNLFFRDTKYVVDGLLTVGIFATSVYYPLHGYFLLNPLTLYLNLYRDLLAYGRAPDWLSLAIVLILSVIVLLAGTLVFEKGEYSFAENL